MKKEIPFSQQHPKTTSTAMRILEYTDLDTSGLVLPYKKAAQLIENGDFRAAQVKKLVNLSQGKFYRAKLNDTDRLVFSLVQYENEVAALMLEIIRNHNYEKSRFLRGAAIDESKVPDANAVEAINDALPLRYLHPDAVKIQWLDKPISFDTAQETIYRSPSPIVVVGSAGSGKTALTLEKLKHTEGNVLYVTHSAFLAQSARDLYYASGFESEKQDATFLSYREFIESIHVPTGREALWRDFFGWFSKMRQNPTFKEVDPHQAFEEIRGVITAAASGVLSREAYRSLGFRQSIFAENQRDNLYDIFEKYRDWLRAMRFFDLSLLSQAWVARVHPCYDFVVIDEVQDMTAIQLSLVLKTLKKPGHFLLCGDSNQIVHPNFFSWAQVKSLFWQDAALAERQSLHVLAANFRNGKRATHLANQLLKIKHQRFGSIDRESNYLAEAIGGEEGAVHLLADRDATKKELNDKIRQSTQFAVLVMRDEDKALAKRHFSTPLLFSIHEAKGLEYDNIILYRFVSDHRAEFADITDGVSLDDLDKDSLDYRRAKDKGDKSLEVYKFFVNALYVALTRAIKNIYLIESDREHPLFSLLQLFEEGQVQVEAKESSLEDWQKEARKLELQGKQEQADAIREQILKEAPVPWQVFDEEKTRDLMMKVFLEKVPGGKPRQQLQEIAAYHDLPVLAFALTVPSPFNINLMGDMKGFHTSRLALAKKSSAAYGASNFKEILKQCDKYGLEHRLPMNQTPLMAAASQGNVALVKTLLERGADLNATDHFGLNALHHAMNEAFREARFAKTHFALLYELLAPAVIDINLEDRMIRIDKHLSEYFLIQTFWVLFKTCFTYPAKHYGAVNTAMILECWKDLPGNVLASARKSRSYLSGLLARNEVSRDYTYNRQLFIRLKQGEYQLNPALLVRQKAEGVDTWVPICKALNLPILEKVVPGKEALLRYQSYAEQANTPQRSTHKSTDHPYP